MKDETVLITGATGLIGQEFTKFLISKNYKVIFTSSDKKKIREISSVSQEIKKDDKK